MEIYLVRHTTPDIEKGICYGQADIDVTASFHLEANSIKQHLPETIKSVYSSPLQRCRKLATYLFPNMPLLMNDQLMEINCGEWEMKAWDDIPRESVMPWLNDLKNARIPGGESYMDQYERVVSIFDQLQFQPLPAVLFVHGGVIRSILAHITGTPLLDSFKAFTLHYGCVIKLVKKEGSYEHEILSNIPHEKETHKPSYF